ncbi:MAG: FHA domain-containing protein [Planctomycetota bacterium]|nr:FHA domain-containing protein [Planctomycetota bacterium]
MSNKLIQCPGCGFNNRLTDVKCLFCGSPLQAASLPSGSDADSGTAVPETKELDEAAQKKADEHIEAAKKGVVPAQGLPDGVSLEGTRSTQRFKREDLLADPSITQSISAAAEAVEEAEAVETNPLKKDTETQAFAPGATGILIPDNVSRKVEEKVMPKRGETTAFRAAADGTLLFWIFCDPLEPIPLGFSREITAGRHHKNDLVLPHNEVSRFHASFKVRGRAVTLEDLGSSNGVIVNGVRRLQHMVAVEDHITIGPYELLIKDKADYVQGANSEDELNKTRTSPSFNAFSEENVALSGNLQDTPLSEILQGFEFNQKTGTLVVIHRNIFGWVGVKNGQPHSSGFEKKSGVDAVLTMLKFEDGHFTFYNTEPEGERVINGSITGILLDYSRSIDEGQGMDDDNFLMSE